MSNGKAKTFVMIVLAVCVLAPVAPADVRVATIIGSNMVLQREMAVPIWGWADAGEKVTVTFAGQSKTATGGADGKWMVKLDALKTCAKPADMTVAGANNTITLKNILVGEVWIGSGQSNMEMGVGGCLDARKFIDAAKYPTMRLITVRKNTSGAPLTRFEGSWQVCTPGSAGRFSATLFFFGQKLHKELGVPIGLIHSSWGGTRVEPWTPPCGFRAVASLKGISDMVDKANAEYAMALAGSISRVEAWVTQAKKALAANTPIPAMPAMPKHRMNSSGAPTGLYNAMIHPLIPFAVRGATWYQGESNGGEGMSYFEKKKALIGGWRKLWGYDLSFYFVQLANFQKPNPNPAGGDGWARVREAQTATLSLPKTGMAVIIDIGMARDIHPKNKQDVGKRLALWALAKDYGKAVVYSGPMFKSMAREGKAIRLTFDYVGGGLMVGKKEGLTPTSKVPGGTLKHFAIAGADKKWHWADAKIEDKTVVVSSVSVPVPLAVRYAYSMNPEGCNLYNAEGLPAVPFRTDTW